MTFDREQFESDKVNFIEKISADNTLKKLGVQLFEQSDKYNYPYLWSWLGMPIIQMPEDTIAFQEIIWKNQPDVIIETGIAWGGSTVFYASLLNLCGNNGRVIAIDVVLPQKNIDAIKSRDFKNCIHLFQGSSSDPALFNQIKNMIKPHEKVMIILDSNHTHEHVLAELELWSPLVSPGQFLVVSDTCVEDIETQHHRPRPWGKGNNPKTAVLAFLKNHNNFCKENIYNKRALTSTNYEGYLERLE
ncbi:MAG: hypothetical protein A3H51_02230 [Candidatus Spechtbacteria bacterium RIFCSPLOWO2_02_FULL_38_8]|uniref:Uncharacterized protein n=1 Tax=Candidatus Spechtbacteria bacterium RIFCSPLOWO2_02_FULL_38_8 TaxID=1802164 RepID=A0A1G2HIQ2_9BACT|nr:MAG: hypothetical protein A3H51_02230 [Candidatus Spechtbacteria bacterium RIFCSPLOWO2_02_FULL_38_8]